MIKIAVFGAAGRMGTSIVRCASRLGGFQVAAAVDCCAAAAGKDAGVAAGIEPLGVAISADAAAAFQAADAGIDFSAPSAAPAHAAAAAAARKPLVLGTTGLAEREADSVRRAAAQIAIVQAPNMSLGVNLLFALVEQAAKALAGYDIEVLEMHHRRKKDAPSGTALGLAAAAARGAGLDLAADAVYGRRGITGERPGRQIGIHALRAGDIVGEHTVFFAAEGERVEFSHKASSRDTFARGALKAAEWLVRECRGPGLYDMRDVLGLRG